MITVQLTFNDDTVSDTIAAASLQGLSFNDYVEWRLNVELDAAVADQVRPALPSEQTVDEIAKALYLFALHEPAKESDDNYSTEGRPYLVEDLYKRQGTGSAWNLRDRGNRIMIGKAFKRLVDAQLPGGRQIDDGRQMRVDVDGRTAQNQTRYRTVRVG